MLTNKQISYLPYDDYAQSANTLFHFMTKPEYLESILRRKAIIPRYCVETIDYLNIHNGTHSFNEAAILQKCFCDIPFHKLADSFAVNAIVKDIQKSDDGTVQILYGDTDSKPMYISFSAFETVEEAKHEENTILQHDEIYVNALTSNAYINQYYEE